MHLALALFPSDTKHLKEPRAEMFNDSLRVCPSCSYEDDDCFTSTEPNCPMCNINIDQAIAQETQRKKEDLARHHQDEELQRAAREEEAQWRERRSITESLNAKNFDPSFIVKARRLSQTAVTEAQAREDERQAHLARAKAKAAIEEVMATRKRAEDATKTSPLSRPSPPSLKIVNPKAATPIPVSESPPEEAPAVISTANANGQASPALLQLLAELPRTPITVYIAGMPAARVGRSSLKQMLAQGVEHLQLGECVTLLDNCEEPLPVPPPGSGGASLVLSVYDVCNEKSFLFSVKQSKQLVAAQVPVVLVGNKIDLEYWRCVQVRAAAEAVESLGVLSLEVSALSGLHVGYLTDAVLKAVFAPHFTRAHVEQLLESGDGGRQGVALAVDDPQLRPYVRMLRVGVAAEAVLLKMAAEGVRRRVLLSRFPRVEYVPPRELAEEEAEVSSGETSSSSDHSDADSSSDDGDTDEVTRNIISKPAHRGGRRKSGSSTAKSEEENKKERSTKEEKWTDSPSLLGSISSGTRLKKTKDSEKKQLEGAGGREAASRENDKRSPKKAKKRQAPQKNMALQPQQQQWDAFSSVPLSPPLPPAGGGPPPPPPIAWNASPASLSISNSAPSSSRSSTSISFSPPAPAPAPRNLLPPRSINDAMRDQDQDLDRIAHQVEELKSIGASVNSEIMQQNHLLDAIDKQMDGSDIMAEMRMSLASRRKSVRQAESDDEQEEADLDWGEERELKAEAVCVELSDVYGGDDDDSNANIFEEFEGAEDVDVNDSDDVDSMVMNEDFRQEDGLAGLTKEMDAVQSIMHMNIEQVMHRGERLERLCVQSGELELQAATFKKQSKSSSGAKCLCCCCILCVRGAAGCADLCRTCARNSASSLARCTSSLKELLLSLLPKKSLMDNVLADTENAFQTLAKTLNFLIGNNDKFRCLGAAYYYMFGVWHQLLAWVASYALILSSTVVMILPSFFTLLIVRTSTIEKESKSFGIRQETIRHEKKEQSALRWLRITLRSLPMSVYLLVLPYLLVYRVFPGCSDGQITGLLVGYLAGVIVLQVLGSVRVYHSWKTRDFTLPAPPDMYYTVIEPAKESTVSRLTSCCRRSSTDKSFDAVGEDDCAEGGEEEAGQGQGQGKGHEVRKKTPVPVPPNTFTTSAANIVVLLSLALEYFQMASFSLQNNPLDGVSGTPGGAAGLAEPSAAPTLQPDDDFWGATLFDSVYVKVALDSNLTVACMWAALGAVGLLLVVFAAQFLSELKRYGSLLRRVEDKDEAKDAFFFSFTGAIVYGHGKPNNISKRMRLVVSVLSDALFLVISMQLLTVLACESEGEGEAATLRVEQSVVCWEGEHALLATLSLMAYAFYVPLSIMITPMLLEAPAPESKDTPKDEGVAFLKLYLMTINVVKSVLLVAAVLGPQTISALVAATCASSLLLGGITVAWFSGQDITKMTYSSAVHPCNMMFINFWKAASYTTSVLSALVVVIFHLLQDSASFVTPRSLTHTLVICWVCVVAVYAALYYQHHEKAKPRRLLVARLIAHPFQWRDLREAAEAAEATEAAEAGGGWRQRPLRWWSTSSGQHSLHALRHIPGFAVSPWQEARRRLTTSPSALTAATRSVPDLSGASAGATSSGSVAVVVEDLHGEALSFRLLQHFDHSYVPPRV